eukprot:180359_1
MLSPNIQKLPANSCLRILNKSLTPNIYSIQTLQFHHIHHIQPSLHLHQHSLYHHPHFNFSVQTTKQKQAAYFERQKEIQKENAMRPELQAVYPGDLSDEEDEYIPEVDWDHTRFESHYKRIWEQEPEPESTREKIYNRVLKCFVVGTWVVGAGCFLFGCFAWYKMKRQLKYVRRTQRSIRFMRKTYDKHLTQFLASVPLDVETMDVTRIKNMLLPLCDIDETHLSVDNLNEKCELWNTMLELELPLNDIIDYEGLGCLDVEDVTYFIALLHYFLGQKRRKGTPSVRRQVRDDIYKMLHSYSDGNVTLKNMGSYACACFCLAIISPPNLGDDKIGGQTLDEFKINYCKYMLRDEEMVMDSEVTVRKFNFIYKICDFSIGLTPETRGQLSK